MIQIGFQTDILKQSLASLAFFLKIWDQIQLKIWNIKGTFPPKSSKAIGGS